jgi:hypothetical protein
MASEHMAKPAIVSDEPALKIEQLGGPLNRNSSDSLSEFQARCLRRPFALGYYLAYTISALAYGVVR